MKKRPKGPVIRLGADVRSDDATTEPRPAIVTARNPHRRQYAAVPEETPEELQRRGDAADALWRELVRMSSHE
jgi:hypothetical protein